jgi:hypothetical protein
VMNRRLCVFRIHLMNLLSSLLNADRCIRCAVCIPVPERRINFVAVIYIASVCWAGSSVAVQCTYTCVSAGLVLQ